MHLTQSVPLRTVARFPRCLILLLTLSLANVSEAQRAPNGERQAAAPGKSRPAALTLAKDPRGSTDHESFRFTYQPGSTADAIHGILLKPQGEGPFPAVIVNHGRGGNAEGFGRQYGSLFVAKRYVVIAAELTHAGQGDPQTFSQAASRTPTASRPASLLWKACPTWTPSALACSATAWVRSPPSVPARRPARFARRPSQRADCARAACSTRRRTCPK